MSWKISLVLFAFVASSFANFLDFSICPGKPSRVDGPLLVYSEVCKRESFSEASGSNICNLTTKVFQVIFNVDEISLGLTANVSATKFERNVKLASQIYLPTSLETASIDHNLKNEKDFSGTVDPNHQFHRYIILNINVASLAIPEENYSYVFRGISRPTRLNEF